MQELLQGIMGFNLGQLIMMIIGGLLIYLAIAKDYEPMLLLPIGFGAILANIPFSSAIGADGFLSVLYNAGIKNELFPVLIFIAVGAMIDFGPLLQNPFMLFFGAAAQFGIFATMIASLFLGDWLKDLGLNINIGLKEAASIGIIGAADGPTSIYVANKFAKDLLAPISVAAYSYMSLVPIIQPPVIKFLTSKRERMIRMETHEIKIPKIVKILFPIMVTVVAGIIAPISVALVGSLMFGNLIRECGVLERLSKAAQSELANLVTLLLGITIGSTMVAEKFLNMATIIIMVLGLVAFIFDTAGGVLFAKFLNLFLKRKVNPMVGAAGISAFPMSARVIQRMAQKEDPTNFVLMQAVSANVAGQLGSIVAGGLLLAIVPALLK
jgi:sodium ion-translocating decarboxylase beta subunit